MKAVACIILLASLMSAEDLMVERMQSVVDEVTELRARYEASARNNEACEEQVREQAGIIEAASKSEGLDYKTFKQNRKRLALLEDENSALQKRLAEVEAKAKGVSGLEEELGLLIKENTRLNRSAEILQGENRALLDQLDSLKRSYSSEDELKKEVLALQERLKPLQEKNRALEHANRDLAADILPAKALDDSAEEARCRLLSKENRRLEEALEEMRAETASLEKACVSKRIAKVTKPTQTKGVCLDDNPFPKLMMKEQKGGRPAAAEKRVVGQQEVPNSLEASMAEDTQEVVLEEGRTYRLKNESAIYEAPGGKVIAVWEEKTSFTSNIYKGEWIKITGHFIDMKWTRSAEEMWIKEKDTLKR